MVYIFANHFYLLMIKFIVVIKESDPIARGCNHSVVTGTICPHRLIVPNYLGS